MEHDVWGLSSGKIWGTTDGGVTNVNSGAIVKSKFFIPV